MAAASTEFVHATYDPLVAAEQKAYLETKAGVKGLMDAGIKELPRIFHTPPHFLHDNPTASAANLDLTFPVIDLAGGRKDIVDKIRDSSENWGFFQIVNHGVPLTTMDEMKASVHRFFHQDISEKKEFFGTDPTGKVVYLTNERDWSDLMLVDMAPDPPRPEQLPSTMRDVLREYSDEMFRLGDLLLELLSEALGLDPGHLKGMECAANLGIASHYYPVCPQPELTLGITNHTDLGFVTVLLQDHVGGLQVLHRDFWVDVPPRPDALVVNIGDMLQLITNDKFKSVKHRAVVNSVEPRVSVGAFFGYGSPLLTRSYGPIKELLSEENPAKYRETKIREFFVGSYNEGIGNTYLPLLKI
ncbi:unnamed protein product [Linum tenue]|uniref:Fe2OG dioxygenase domain-containing protein n=1 Tax=Linum tenue TaxID=586396 RepID=A0AAV0RR37_9ROSI|nr:unnamed protein product [Linum tenue]